MENLKNKRILGTIGLIALLLGIFLPYYRIKLYGNFYSISIWSYWEGKIIFIINVLNTLYIFRDLLEQNFPQLFNSKIGKIIKNATPKLSIIPIIIMIIFLMILKSELDVGYNHSLGFYCLWIGIIFQILHTFIYKQKN